MKNFFTKMITVYVVIASLALVLKVGDNILAKASTSNVADQCGTNNGWIWNGTQCVNTCDIFHPWDPNQGKCSNTSGSNYYNTTTVNGNCTAYGSNFYFNGTNCVQIVAGQNTSYSGYNPLNGGYAYINTSNTNTYNNNTNTNWYPNTNTNTTYTYYPNTNTNTGCTNTSCGSCPTCWVNPGPKTVTTYETHTYTEYIQGTPIPTYGTPNYNYNYPQNNNTCWYSTSNYCNCNDYIHTGYYDQYGIYHY